MCVKRTFEVRLSNVLYVNFLFLAVLVPSEAPGNFTVMNITDTISIQWSAIDIESINGILLGYHLYYKIVNLSDSWSNATTDNSTLALSVFPVKALRTYELQLCGFTAVGNGVCTPKVVVTTPGTGE